MILTDGIHLVSDTSMEELHAFARKIGLKRHRFHYGSRHPHYDISGSVTALVASARPAPKLVTRREIVKQCVRPLKIRAWAGKKKAKLTPRDLADWTR